MPIPSTARPSIVAFGEEESAYVLKLECAGYRGLEYTPSAVPGDLEKVIQEREEDDVRLVALGPQGEWFISFEDEDWSTFFGNTSHVFAAAVRATQDNDGKMQISWVAFGPSGSFFVQRTRGEALWYGLPKILAELVAKSPRDVVHLALGRPTGWCVLFGDGAWAWSLPSEHGLHDMLSRSAASQIKQVFLGNNGDFFMHAAHGTYFSITCQDLRADLSYYCHRSSRRQKIQSAVADSPTLPRAFAELMTVLMKVLEEHCEDCYFDQLLEAIRSKLLIDPQFTRIYSFHPACYGQRGGQPYFKPCGWRRCSLAIDNFEEFPSWCIAYHGTSCRKVASIMLRGLRRPGDEGVDVEHGQAYSDSGCSIYVSPSIEYAAFPVYAEFFTMQDDHWAQLVLECRVRPASFTVKPGSLGNKYWPEHLRMDSNFETNSELEWLIESPDDVVFTGLMIREFGEAASEEIYGHLARQVTWGSQGPQYEWTKLRAAEYERLQYCI